MTKPNQSAPFSYMDKIEDRILFDAVPDGGAVPTGESDQPQVAQHQSIQDQQADHGSRELIVIDASVENSSELLSELLASNPDQGYEVRYLTADTSGIDQISAFLEEQAEGPYDAVHIISHGEEGRVHLGNTILDSQSAQTYAVELAEWGNYLSQDADLLFYGCDLSADESGRSLASSLASLTGADIASSDDTTGHASLGGDWDLENATGQIDARILDGAEWLGRLAPTLRLDIGNVQPTEVDTTGAADGSLGLQATFVDAGFVGAQRVDLRATIVSQTTNLTHDLYTRSFGGGFFPSIESAGDDLVEIRWEVFETGTTNPVTADVIVGLNDLDGPNNELVQFNVCDPVIENIVLSENTQLDHTFDSATGIVELAGTANYSAVDERISVQVTYSDITQFNISRSANSGFVLSFDFNETLTYTNPLTFECGDFQAPVSVDDSDVVIEGNTANVNILDNDSSNSGAAAHTVNLIPPAGFTNPVTDSNGDLVGFDMPGQGTWAFNSSTGVLSFAPATGFTGDPTPIGYEFENIDGVTSNQSTVTLDYQSLPEIDLDANDSVTAGTGYATNYFPGDGAVNVTDVDPSVIDNDGTELATLTITPAGTLNGASEVVYFAGDGATSIDFALDGVALTQQITVNGELLDVAYDGTEFLITAASGNILLGDVASLMAGMTYANTDPLYTDGERTFEFVGNDGTYDSNTAISRINAVHDTDGDGVFDADDIDDDNDGILDVNEVPAGAVGAPDPLDLDGDGVRNSLDLDTDNDGISDLVESGSAFASADTNNDGMVSIAEAEAILGVGNADADDDGLLDIFDANTADTSTAASQGTTPRNSDPDAAADFYDLDSDNDGIADAVEARATAGYTTNDGDVTNNDADGDGVLDQYDANDATTGLFGGTFANPVDTDGDGVADYRDTNSDNDGLSDTAESGLTLSGNDTNGDGIDDGVGASYADPDGVVNNPSANLDNEYGDTSEIAFREGSVWEISGPVSGDEGQTVQYALSLSGTLPASETATIDIAIADITTTSADYANFAAAVSAAATARPDISFNSGTGTLTYTTPSDGAAMAPLLIDLSLTDDTAVEGPEDYRISLTNPGSTSGVSVGLHTVNNTVQTTINDTQGVGGGPDTTAWSISGDTSVDEGAAATYTVSLAGVVNSGETATVELSLTDLDTNSADYAAFATAVQTAVAADPTLSFNSGTGELTFTSNGAAMNDLVFSIGATDDALVEGDEQLRVQLANPWGSVSGGTTINASMDDVTTTINDTVGDGGIDESVIWTFGADQTVDEGTNTTWNLSLGNGILQSGESVSVDIALANTDTNASDYGDFSAAVTSAVAAYAGPGSLSFNSGTGTITFVSDGNAMATLPISLATVDDAIAEGPEDFVVQISNPVSSTGASVSVSPTQASSTVTIDDTTGAGADQAVWSVTGDTTVDEGGDARYTISLSGTVANGETATVELAIVDFDTDSSDYQALSTAVQNAVSARPDLTFNSGTGVLTFTGDGNAMADLMVNLTATDDAVVEGPEQYSINLSNAGSTSGILVGVDGAADSVQTTIEDTVGDGGATETAQWSITGAANVAEGSPLSWQVTLGSILQAGEIATVDLALSDIDTNSADYGDFQAAVNSAVTAYSGPGSLAFNSSTGTLTFVSDGNAMSPLNISLGTTADAYIEGPEQLRVDLSAPGSTSGANTSLSTDNSVTTTISDDETATWNISGPVSSDEGATAVYTVSLTGQFGAGEVVYVDLNLNDIDTNAGDYGDVVAAITAAAAANPDVTFNAGTGRLTFTSASEGATMTPLAISLPMVDDALIEGPEDFSLNLTADGSSTGADTAIGTAVATTTINDTQGTGGPADGPGTWQISGPASADEGSTAQFTVSLTGAFQAGEVVSVDIDLSNIDTTSGDYASFVAAAQAAAGANPDVMFNPASGTFTFTSPSDGAMMTDLVIDLGIVDDPNSEGPEDFQVSLSGAASTTGLSPVVDAGNDDVVVTINDTQGPGGIADGNPTWSVTGPVNQNEGTDATYAVALSGAFQAGEMVSVEIRLADIETTAADYGDLLTAIASAAAANPDVTFDAGTTTLTYTAPTDGASMTPLMIDLPIVADGMHERPELFSIELSNASSTSGITIGVSSGSGRVETTINGNPVARQDLNSTLVDTPVDGNVLVNDTDLDGDAITVTMTNGQPIGIPVATTNGSVVMNANGDYTYTPNAGFVGTDSFTYEVCDAGGNCDMTTVSIEVRDTVGTPGNTPPVANNDTAQTQVDQPVGGSLISNDGDPDGDVLMVNTTPINGPGNGSVVINSDGTYVYTPGSGYTGTDTFTYEVCDAAGACDTATVTISVVPDSNGPANDPPFAGDDAGYTQKNESISGDLLANDNDPNGDVLTVNVMPVLAPANGTVTINPDGTYMYTPDNDFVGTDRFVYEVCDPSGACEQATVSITVFDAAPVAIDDFNTTNAGTPVSGNVLTNDENPNVGDDLTVNTMPVSGPVHGTLTLNPDGTYTYIPNDGFVGVDSFEYEVCDEGGNCDTAIVTIEVRDTVTNNENDRGPIANNDWTQVQQGGTVVSSLISNDGHPDGSRVAVRASRTATANGGMVEIFDDGTYAYTPDPSFIGRDSFTYELCDANGNCDVATVIIDVVPDSNGAANDPPFAGDDSAIVQKGIPYNGNVAANDVDPNGDPLTVNTTPVTPPTNGTLTLNPDGSFTYTPNPGFSGNDSFEYEICDDSGACDIATAHITVFNEAPVAVADDIQVVQTPHSGDVTLNDTDPDGDPMEVRLITPPEHGTLVLNIDGTFTYTPGPTYEGNDSFTYELCDDSGACSSATVTLTTPFAFDAITNEAPDFTSTLDSIDRGGVDFYGSEVLLSERLAGLASEPILAGYAQPSSILVGRVYDMHGALVGETTTQVNRAGNWVMHFFGVEVKTDYRVMIEHVATEEVELGNHHFRLTPDTYRALQLGAQHLQSTTVGSILADAPSTSLEIWHNQNVNPLRLL